MAAGKLDKLIETMSASASRPNSAQTAAIRMMTDTFIVASDRYDNPSAEMFDLLLSRTTASLDQHIRKLIVMSLVRAGARDEHVRIVLSETTPRHVAFLRRSVVQTQDDLLAHLNESIWETGDGAFPDPDDQENPSLSPQLLHALHNYIARGYLATVAPRVGAERADVAERTVKKAEAMVTAAAARSARDDLLLGRSTVSEWVRRQAVNPELLAELLNARAMTEFNFSLSAIFDVDVPTAIRILNDSTFDGLVVFAKAANFSPEQFANVLSGLGQRRGDGANKERAIRMYALFRTDLAIQVLDAWRERVLPMGGAYAAPDLRLVRHIEKTSAPIAVAG